MNCGKTPSPVGEGAERRNGAHLSPPLVRRFPLFAQKAIANAQRKDPLPHGGGSRTAKWRAFVPASRSALPVVCAESDSLMRDGKTPSPRGGGLGWGSLAYLETTPSLAGRSPQRGKVQTGETACIRSRLPFGASRCLRRKRQLNELRKDPLPPWGRTGEGFVGKPRNSLLPRRANPAAGEAGEGAANTRRATLPIYIHYERSGVCKPPNSPVARHGPFIYTTSARVYVNHQTAPSRDMAHLHTL